MSVNQVWERCYGLGKLQIIVTHNRIKEKRMTHPKQLDEVGITESYLRKMAKKEGVTYKKAVQIAMEQWGEYSLKLINKMVAEDIKTR